ncbi:Ni/Fe hydrogenase subunit alpha, partial [candidate division WOR-3 bacterium]|nr:Ni/Fe hydrogenase subunit alpha [candidate division WOR-3 bacterium]
IEPIARVEGHGGIRVEVEKNKIKKITVDIYEGPRLIEQMVVGKTPEEDVSITSRICAICFASHRLAAITGLEKALGIKVSKKTELLRELAHFGEMIESHSLHYYLLALPDLVGYPDAITMVNKYPDDVVGGLELKKFGNRVMEIVAGRRIHGENMRIGGFGKIPSDEELNWIKRRASELIPIIESGLELWGKLEIPDYMEEETNFVCMEPGNNQFGFSGTEIMVSDGTKVDVEEYKKITNERVVEHSFAKRCRYKGRPYTVGAIARIINLGDRIKTPIARDYLDRYYDEKKWKRNPIYNNVAQAIEVLWCLEKIPELVDEIKKAEYKPVKAKKEAGTGTGGIEAPRGTLFHSYKIKNGLVAEANFIAPTTQNLDEMEKYMMNAAKNLLNQNKEDIELPLEIIVRAFDPCISCSAHLVRVVKKADTKPSSDYVPEQP